MEAAQPCGCPQDPSGSGIDSNRMSDCELMRLVDSLNDRYEYSQWKRQCEMCLESMRAECRDIVLRRSTGRLNSLTARILRLAGAWNDLRSWFDDERCESDSRRGFAWVEVETAFEKRVLIGAIVNSCYLEPQQFLDAARNEVLDRVCDCLERHVCLKVNTVFNGEFVAKGMVAVKTISTKNRQLFRASDLTKWYKKCVVDATLSKLEEFQERDSGWALSRILNLTVNINKCNPMRVGCWVEIPLWIQLKKAVLNVRATDNACFAWAITAALYLVKNSRACRSNEYPHYSTVLNLDGIDFPVALKQIDRFERFNIEISINVYTIEETRRGGNDGRRIIHH